MANAFGSLYVGASGLQNSQHALNTTANNLANVDTKGYVRQQVLFSDRNYITFNTTAAISKQQSGLGVQIADVVHSRDIFLDRAYRTENSRQAFYQSTYEAALEVETYFQELEGQTFQSSMEDFWVSFQELSKAPDDSVNQNLVIQKAQLFLQRAGSVYDGLKSYQYNINTQISDDIDKINELGKMIHELNMQIQDVEAGDIETAMTLRDARDQALDELSALAEISYHETESGSVKVSLEGVEFVDEISYHKIEKKYDEVTGFITPYWGYLSDTEKGKYANVFEFDTDISTENENDMGKLKGLILARGDHIANYTDVLGMDKDTFNDTTGMSIMLSAQAELDQLIHGIVTTLNDILCPNITADKITGGNPLTVTLPDGTTRTIGPNTKILDTANCATGSDGELPPQELFVRVGSERYTEATYTDANGQQQTIYIYNEEDPSDPSKQYTLESLKINEKLIGQEGLLPHLKQDGTVDYDLAKKLATVWDEDLLVLNPNDTKPCSFKDYYGSMIGEMSTIANVYGSTAASLEGTVAAADNQRQQVIGVSSDEELTYMIKYQNAYNAASRFINVIDEMIEHLITQLG
mgnify:FL=1